MTLLHELPRWLGASLTLVTFVVLALAGLLSTRRWIRGRGLHALVDNGVVGWIFSAMLSIYAITIGLTAVASWSKSVAAAKVASLEAAQVAALLRDFEGYPESVRRDLQERLTAYLKDIITTAWPAQRRGEIPHGGTSILNGLERPLYTFEPATDGQRAAHAEALGAFNRIVETRRQRLEDTRTAVPGTLWAVVLIGAALSIGASYLFNMETVGVHATMVALLASMIALLVFFIAVTDLPFQGPAGISPTAYEIVLHDLVDARAR